jgi:hypothetical protein
MGLTKPPKVSTIKISPTMDYQCLEMSYVPSRIFELQSGLIWDISFIQTD